MSNMVPGRPRRQQQAYRQANTSLTLMSTGGQAGGGAGGSAGPGTGPTGPTGMDSDPDPYISCTNVILDKFSNGSTKDTAPYAMSNGSPARKNSGGIKDFL